MGRPEAQNDVHPHTANQAPAYHLTSKSAEVHYAQQSQQQQAAERPLPLNNPLNIIGHPDHEVDDHRRANIDTNHDQTHHQQALQQPDDHDHPVPITPPNPSQSMESSRRDHHREYQANQQAINQTDHHRQSRPLHVVVPPPNLYSTNLMLHQYNWPHYNYNAPAPAAYQAHHQQALVPPHPAAARPPPTPYYPPPHHNHATFYYSAPQGLFPPPASYQFFPPHSGQLQSYNPAAVAYRNQLPPLHYNNYHAETGMPVLNTQHLPMVLPQSAGVDGTWKTGLFQCFQDRPNGCRIHEILVVFISSALITLLFPCWTFGQIAEIVDNGRTSCATYSIIYMLISVCIFMPCLLSCVYRKRLRNKFDLPESPAPDCIIHFLCEWCALCQEHRELELRGLDPSLGWVGNMEQIQRLQQKRQAEMDPPMTQRMTNY